MILPCENDNHFYFTVKIFRIAITECFKIMQTGITDRENRKEMAKIKEALDKLEGNNPEIIDV